MKVAGPILSARVYMIVPWSGTLSANRSVFREPTSGLEPLFSSHYEWQGHTRHTSHEQFPRVIGCFRESFVDDPRDEIRRVEHLHEVR